MYDYGKLGRDIKTIGKHINNALHKVLASDPTGANFATIDPIKSRIKIIFLIRVATSAERYCNEEQFWWA